MAKKNAPTSKIENNIDNGLFVTLENGVMLCAKYVESYDYVEYVPALGTEELRTDGDYYAVTSHQGQMPAFHEDRFDGLQGLANAMRSYADLRTWKLIDHS